MGSKLRAWVAIVVGVVGLCWAAAALWLTVGDSHHREFYAGPGVWVEVRPGGNLGVHMRSGQDYRFPVLGGHPVTAGVLAVTGATLVGIGWSMRRGTTPTAPVIASHGQAQPVTPHPPL